MRLFEVYTIQPEYAWFEPGYGPNNIKGVYLAFLEPIQQKFSSHIEDAANKKDVKRIEQTREKLNNYINTKNEFLTHTLGWWPSEQAFMQGEPNPKGLTKGNIFAQYPNLKIFPSKKQAVATAKNQLSK